MSNDSRCPKYNLPQAQWWVNRQIDTKQAHQHQQQAGDTKDANVSHIAESSRSNMGDERSIMNTTMSSRSNWFIQNQNQEQQVHHLQISNDVPQFVTLEQRHRCGKSHTSNMRNKITFDSASTLNLWCNPKLCVNICKADHTIEMSTNAGKKMHDTIAMVPDIESDVWYDPKAMTNIVSQLQLKNKYRITYDNAVEDAYIVYIGDDILKFSPDKENGLYTYTPSNKGVYDDTQQHQPLYGEANLVTTVQENSIGYTPNQIKEAQNARRLYHTFGAPSIDKMKAMIRMNMISNCPVTTDHVNKAEMIYGKDVSTLKGKSVR